MKSFARKLKLLAFAFFSLALFFLAPLFFKNSREKTLTIGAKSNTEQQILAELLAQLIEKNTSIKVIRKFNLDGTSIAFNALKTAAIDIYFEYTGTALLHILKEPLCEGPLYPYVKDAFERKYGITWKQPLGFSNQYVLIAHKNLKITKIEEIRSDHKIAYDPEFSIREEAALLKKNYPSIAPPKLMDQLILYFSLNNGSADVISGVSTSGHLVSPDLIILEDKLETLPAYEVAPLIRYETLERYPELEPLFTLISNLFTLSEMRDLNYAVEFEGQDIEAIASKIIKSIKSN